MSNNEIELMRIGDPKYPIVIAMKYFEGMVGLDIRKHYYSKTTGETVPSSKGIFLKEEEFLKVLKCLLSEKENIENLFTGDLSENEINIRGRRLEKKARRDEIDQVDNLEVESKSWPGTNFFNYRNEGNDHVISFNSSLQIFKKADDSFIFTLGRILYAYEKSKLTIDDKKSENLFQLMELEWGNQISRIKK